MRDQDRPAEVQDRVGKVAGTCRAPEQLSGGRDRGPFGQHRGIREDEGFLKFPPLPAERGS